MTNFEQTSVTNKYNDVKILNQALIFEHQCIWAYKFAIGKLSYTAKAKTFRAIALENKADHEQHRDILSGIIRDLEGDPIPAEASYDLSKYLNIGEGSLVGDVSFAKLALALETDAAIAYITQTAKLKSPSLIITVAGIGSIESIHAARFREVLNQFEYERPVIPSAIMSAENRAQWILNIYAESECPTISHYS